MNFSSQKTTLRVRLPLMIEFQDFKIIKKIGSGATSNVYLGERPNGEKRALKVFNHFLPEGQGDITFGRELSNLGRIKNDKIIGVHGLEKNSKGDWVLIQEYIEGISLFEYLKEQLSPLDRAIIAMVVASEILYGLEESHLKGIIHRDIKPENILLEQMGRIVLSDFGLSKNIFQSQKTLHGSLFGSPQYMSLSQFKGAKVTNEIDLYATCVLIYEIIAGIPPFLGENIEEIISSKRSGNCRPLGKANPYTPVKLGEIVHQALNNDLTNFNHAHKLRYELLLILEHLKIDNTSVIKSICSKKEILSQENQTICKKLILEDLEIYFDNEKNHHKKNLLLGQILVLNSNNHRGKPHRIKLLSYVTIPILIILVAFFYLINSNYHLPIAKNTISNQTTTLSKIVPQVQSETVSVLPVKNIQKITPSRVVQKQKVIQHAKQKGYLVLNVPTDITVQINNKSIDKLGKKISFPPGKYLLTLSKSGYPSMSSEIKIIEGKDTIINLE